MTAFLYVYLDDADATFRTAVAAGARAIEVPMPGGPQPIRLHSKLDAGLQPQAGREGWMGGRSRAASSYCSLAQGSVLATKVFDAATVTAIATNTHESPLDARERAMMAFAEQVALNADRITAADIDKHRSHGYRDEEIFDVTAAAAARCFFSKLLDALGVQADSTFNDLDPALRQALTVGRPVAERPE
jgi:alkylhydroperoxidase/carboxymuconolactone decarboxylase family protein YurZ